MKDIFNPLSVSGLSMGIGSIHYKIASVTLSYINVTPSSKRSVESYIAA